MADLRHGESGGAPVRIATVTEWVVPTGGGCFFAPSIRRGGTLPKVMSGKKRR